MFPVASGGDLPFPGSFWPGDPSGHASQREDLSNPRLGDRAT